MRTGKRRCGSPPMKDSTAFKTVGLSPIKKETDSPVILFPAPGKITRETYGSGLMTGE
jgi:hypothetical protein